MSFCIIIMMFNSINRCATMPNERISLTRIVFFDPDTEAFCQCSAEFHKTCPLRAANDLPCQESILSITPIVREDADMAAEAVRSLDAAVRKLKHGLRAIEKKPRL